MLRLFLLRHAKSSWDSPAGTDFERPLSPRGERAAPVVGRHMTRMGYQPELVICSPALRTTQTAELVLAELPDKPQIRFEERLYEAGSRVIQRLLQDLDADNTTSVMIVGHNPSIQSAALSLCGDGIPPDTRRRMTGKYPTGGLTAIEFALAGWAAVAAGTGTLRDYTVPRDLAE